MKTLAKKHTKFVCYFLIVSTSLAAVTYHLRHLPIALELDETFAPTLVQHIKYQLQSPLPLAIQPLAQHLQQLSGAIRLCRICRTCQQVTVIAECKTLLCKIDKYILVEDGTLVPDNTLQLTVELPNIQVAKNVDDNDLKLVGLSVKGVDPSLFEQYAIKVSDKHTLVLEDTTSHLCILWLVGKPIQSSLLQKATHAAQVSMQNSRQRASSCCTVDTRFEKQLIVRRQAR